ncbi:MAG: hypothetical protein D4Q77_02930 [Methanothrix sp.]|nr:MAG: hypothetical protein D4Q77_02930 [Methanothrix sp.]
MKRSSIAVLMLALALAVVAPGAAVICQVELNPPGDDQGEEWVELFNPGEVDVKIGGWVISTNSGTAHTLPKEAVVHAKGFYLVKSSDWWLEDKNESITLWTWDDNASAGRPGRKVDATPALDDVMNDNRVWCRLSEDGTDIVPEWRYVDRYHRIDEHALGAPGWAEESVESLAAYLMIPAQDDDEKVRAIYRWITANIDYDTECYFSGCYKTRSGSKTVLNDKKAVCSGYSQLFESLCDAAGLESVRIDGHGKGYGYAPFSDTGRTSDHAWNAVKIDGRWRLVDTTWGAGHIDEVASFVRQFDDYYFLTPPEEFIYTHLPDDPRWQLLERPLSKEEYEDLVYVKPPFFKSDMKVLSHPEGVILTEDKVEIGLFVPGDVLIIAELLDENVNELPDRFTLIRREDDKYVIEAAFPGPGNYTLRIYSKFKEDPGPYSWALDYGIEAGPGTVSMTGFPVTDVAFQEHGLEVESHPEGIIMAKDRVNVSLSAPGDVMIIAELLDADGKELPDRFTFVQREDDKYVVHVAFPRPGSYTLGVYAKDKNDPGAYGWVLNYSIEASGEYQAGFPATYGTFHLHDAHIYGPIVGRLKSGVAQSFRLAVPGAEDVAVINDGRWTHLDEEDGFFEGVVVPIGGEIWVSARFPGEDEYYRLLEYSAS